jgi:hypothetical protein
MFLFLTATRISVISVVTMYNDSYKNAESSRCSQMKNKEILPDPVSLLFKTSEQLASHCRLHSRRNSPSRTTSRPWSSCFEGTNFLINGYRRKFNGSTSTSFCRDVWAMAAFSERGHFSGTCRLKSGNPLADRDQILSVRPCDRIKLMTIIHGVSPLRCGEVADFMFSFFLLFFRLLNIVHRSNGSVDFHA